MFGYTRASAFEQAKSESVIARDGDSWTLTISTGGEVAETRGLHNYEARRRCAAWRRKRVKELLALDPSPPAIVGRRGGARRAAVLSPERRREIAKAAGKLGGRGNRRSRIPKDEEETE